MNDIDLEGYRLLPAQRRVWELAREQHRSLTARVRLAAPLDTERLRSAAAVLSERHEALRLRLAPHPGLRVPLQVVDPGLGIGPGAVGDLFTGPLVSLAVSDGELVLSASELVADAESLRILLRELTDAYAGRSLDDDEDRLQFLDVSEWRLDQGPAREPLDPGMFTLPFVGESGTRQAVIDGARLAALRSVGAVGELVFAAWALTLARYLDDDETLPVAWSCPGRNAEGTAEVVGPLETPVHVEVARSWTARDALRALREAEEALPVAAPADNLIAGFSARLEPDEPADLGAIEVRIETPPPSRPLYLTVEIGKASATLNLSFDQQICDTAGAERLLATVQAQLAELSGESNAALGDAELALLTEWAGADRSEPGPTLTALLDSGIRSADPDREAVLADDGTLTFGELDALATTIAARLTARGIGVEDRVAVLAERSWRAVAAFVGILRAGAVYAPIDSGAPPQRIGQVLDAVRPELLLVTSPSPLGTSISAEEIPARPDPNAEPVTPAIVPEQAAYVICTSGSTGTPKPVVVEQRSAANLAHALAESVYPPGEEALRVAVNAPLSFDASIKQLIQLARGHTVCVLPEHIRQDPHALLDRLASQRVDVLDCTPSHLRLLLTAGTGLPGLVLVGGENVDQDLWDRLARLDVRCVNLYGPTECTVDATAAEITAGQATIGRPLPGVRAWVLDEWLRPVPAGVSGELCVSGIQVARGYLDDPGATTDRFATTVLPDGTRERIYRTGDRVRHLADGRLAYLGRLDDQLKINGIRIEPGEIASILSTHPGVRHSAVTGRDDGQGTRLVAYAQPAKLELPELDGIAGMNPYETRYLYDEIFRRRCYLQGGVVLRENAVVFDVGANIGMFALFARSLSSTADVYSFEPLPAIEAKFRANLGEQARVFPFGLSDVDQEVDFTYYPGYSTMSGRTDYADAQGEVELIKRYLANERDEGGADSAELLAHADELLADRFDGTRQRCRLRRLSDVIDELGVPVIDLLKIDVQRAELDVLRGLDERHWYLVQQVAAEVHDGVGNVTEGRVDEIVAALEDRGFDVTVEQDSVLAGTDRFMLYATRPEYADDLRPVVETEPAEEVSEQALRDWLTQRLPAHLVPTAIVLLEEFPLTPNGKIDVASLPAPATDRDSGERVAPANDVEETLVDIWREVLGLTGIGVTDDFFQLGGDSIRTIRVQAAAARRGLTFPLQSMFAHQTIRDLVNSGAVQDGAAPAEPAGRFALVNEADRQLLPEDTADAYPASVLQQGMLYQNRLTGSAATYHNATTYQVDRELDEDALRTALADTLAAHPILRTGFGLGRYSEPLQLVAATVPVPLVVADLSDLDEAAQRQEIGFAVEEELQRPFDFAAPPLVRFQAFRTGPESFELMVAEYHAVLDGWSLALLLDEIADRYERCLDGGTELPETQPAMPFRRFIELERDARTDPAGRRFWQQQLAGATRLLLAPGTEPPRTDKVLHQPLSPNLLDGLEHVGAELAVPLKALLLAVHLRAMAEHTGRNDVITGLVTSTRTGEEGSDRTLGLFLNTLPMRLAVGDTPLGELAQQAWRAEQQFMAHHLMPLADIEQIAGEGRLFDAFFNFTRFDKPRRAEQRRTHLRPRTTVPVDVGFALAVDFEIPPDDTRLRLSLTYASDRLTDEQVAELTDRYTILLDLMCLDPASRRTPPEPVESVPVTALEDQVATLWTEVLGRRPRSGATDFFEAGGSSLLALRLVAALRERHGIGVDLARFEGDSRFDALIALCRDA